MRFLNFNGIRLQNLLNKLMQLKSNLIIIVAEIVNSVVRFSFSLGSNNVTGDSTYF